MNRPPHRADHVGSLLRPVELIRARERAPRRELPPEELRAIEDEAIRTIVRRQEGIGVRGIADGEFRRTSPRPAASAHCAFSTGPQSQFSNGTMDLPR